MKNSTFDQALARMHLAQTRLAGLQTQSAECAARLRDAGRQRDVLLMGTLIREFEAILREWQVAHDDYQEAAEAVKRALGYEKGP